MDRAKSVKDVVPKLQAVIFDMDGVIADTEPFHTRAYVEVLKTFGIHVSKNHPPSAQHF